MHMCINVQRYVIFNAKVNADSPIPDAHENCLQKTVNTFLLQFMLEILIKLSRTQF